LKKRGIYEVIANDKIAKDVHKMILKGDTSYITFPGQFINIKIDDLYLRRPISICDYDKETITIIFKVVGHGTEKMAEMEKGTKLDILTGLGNGFNKTRSGKSPLLVGGGVGTPPMYRLCKELIDEGKSPIVVLGFNSKEDVFFEDEFKKLGAEVYISTVDGSYGTKGFVTDVIKDLDNYTYHYACGPLPMLKALYNTAEGDGEYSFEERMGCGFGACMGCTVKVKDGFKRVCKDGPVLKKEEIVW
jgi:dihydroorotate dehydrogenase electron transfer subunit